MSEIIDKSVLVSNAQTLTAGKEYRENNRKPFWTIEGDGVAIEVLVERSSLGNKRLKFETNGKFLALSSFFDILQISEEFESGEHSQVMAANRRPVLNRSQADIDAMEQLIPGSMTNYKQAVAYYKDKGKHLYEVVVTSLMLGDD